MKLGSTLRQRLCQRGLFRPRCSRSVLSNSSRGEWEGEDGGGEGEEKGRRDTDETELGEARRDSGRGAEELATLLLTAVGPLDNPGILSEINLSTWSC